MATHALAPAARGYRTGLYEWLTTTDHKKIGILYLINSFIFFFLAGMLALGVRLELAQPGLQFVTDQTYNELFTMHATAMIFLFIIPILAGFANYIVPLQIGAPDMAFPRINALSFWMLPLGGILLFLGFVTGGTAAAGWTSYAPLSEDRPLASVGYGQDLWIVALVLIGTSSILGAINFLVTIFKMRAPGMSLFRMPILVWTMIVTSVLVLMATPVFTSAVIMLFIDRNYGGHFFDPATGGDAILYQNVFWFYSHPAVYVMVLPAMGMISEILPVFSRKPLFGYKAFVFATVAIGALGFSVWAHHMFTTGAVYLPFFSLMTFLIAIPTGVKMFNWIFTMWRGKLTFSTPMLFAVGFLSMFLIGGINGAISASVPVDFAIHDTYWVVSHLHYVLFGGSVFGVMAGFYYWFPKMSGRLAQRDPRQGPVRADVHRLQPDVLPDAPARAHGHAAAHRRLLGGNRLAGPQRRRDRRRVPHRVEHDPVPDQHLPVTAQRRAGRRRSVGGEHTRVGDQLAAAALQLRPAPRDPLRAAAVRRPPRADRPLSGRRR